MRSFDQSLKIRVRVPNDANVNGRSVYNGEIVDLEKNEKLREIFDSFEELFLYLK